VNDFYSAETALLKMAKIPNKQIPNKPIFRTNHKPRFKTLRGEKGRGGGRRERKREKRETRREVSD
jgi:hypothetical protein